MKPHLVYAGTLAFITTLGALTVLVITGHDPVTLVAALSTLIAGVAATYNMVRTTRLESKVDGVATQVNGHMTRALDAAGVPRPTTDDTGSKA